MRTTKLARLAPIASVAFALAACGDAAEPAPPGSAQGNAPQSEARAISGFTLTGSSAGGVDSLVAEVPTLNITGTITESIEVGWNNTYRSLSVTPVFPQGWDLEFYAGNQLLAGPPTTPAGWASVSRVKATGTLSAEGVSGGHQLLTWNVTALAPDIAAQFSGGSTGDGVDVFFDPEHTKIFNVHHHNSPASVMCRRLTDSKPCDPVADTSQTGNCARIVSGTMTYDNTLCTDGRFCAKTGPSTGQCSTSPWPIALTQTAHRATGYIDPPTNFMWVPTVENNATHRIAWDCVDVLNHTRCPTPIVYSTHIAAANAYDEHQDLTVVGRRMYSIGKTASNKRIMCLDMSTGTECTGVAYTNDIGDYLQWGIGSAGNKVYAIDKSNGTLSCYDAPAMTACGAPWPISLSEGGTAPVHPVPLPSGVIENICADYRCFKVDGSATTLPTSYLNYASSNRAGGWASNSRQMANSSTEGTKVAWGTGNRQVTCFDVGHDNGDGTFGAKCAPAFPVSVNAIYQTKLDPEDDNCLWTNGDDGIIRNFRADTGAAGCGGGIPRIQFKASVVIPRLGCDPSTRVYQYRSFKLVNPAKGEGGSSWTAATLTVKDSNGGAVPNWINIPIPDNGFIDLTTGGTGGAALLESVAGDTPTFDVAAAGLNDTTIVPAAVLKVATGSAPQVCLTLGQPPNLCPAAAGLAVLLPAQSVLTNVVGSATYTAGAEPRVDYDPASYTTTGTPGQPSVPTCSGPLSGTARYINGPPVPGAPVELLTAGGGAVNDPSTGLPVNATTAADGTFSFPVWGGNRYRVGVSGSPSADPVSVTVVMGGIGTTNAVSGVATSGIILVPQGGPAAMVTILMALNEFTLVGVPNAGVDAMTATLPVANRQGTIAQSVEAHWDRTLRQLNDVPVYPQGWTMKYFTGTTNGTGGTEVPAPTDIAGWSLVNKISAQGNYESLGTEGGKQVITSTIEAPPPTVAATFSGASAGDGWDLFFDPGYTKVFNIHHHNSPATVMCRNLNGTPCTPTGANSGTTSTWPMTLTQTANRPRGTIDLDANKLWSITVFDSGVNSGKIGWDCVDLTTNARCTAPVVVSAQTASNTSYQNHIDLVVIGRKLYSMGLVSGNKTRIMCLDMATAAECTGVELLEAGASVSGNGDQLGIGAVGTKLFALPKSSGKLHCIESTTMTACGGGSWPVQTSATGRVLGTPSADGVVRSICADWQCFSMDGTAIAAGNAGATTLPARYIAYHAAHRQNSQGAGSTWGGSDTSGPRVAWACGSGTLCCWDMSTDSACDGKLPSDVAGATSPFSVYPLGSGSVSSIYSPRFDPQDDNCLWTNSDDGIIRNFKTLSPTTAPIGCAGGPPRIQFKASVSIPRLGCAPETRVFEYRQFKLLAPTSAQYTSATLSVKDSNGVAIPGWTYIPVPADQTFDISSLTVANAGTTPTFDIKATGLTDLTIIPKAELRVVTASAPQLCWNLNPPSNACPATPGVAVNPPATSTNTTVVANADFTDAEGTTAYPERTYQTQGIQAQPSIAACGASVSGLAKLANGTAVSGVPVELLTAAGAAVIDPATGQPLTTTSGAGGYSFAGLWGGAGYKIRARDPATHAVFSATVVSGGSGTTAAANGVVTSNTTIPPHGGTGGIDILLIRRWVVTVTPPVNGGVVCNPTTVSNGATFACTITPAPGYALDTLTDNGASVVGSVVGGTYTSGAVTADHTITGTFKKDFGSGCGGNAECQGGICVDGVCCNTTCTGSCQACNVAGSAGTCTSTVSASGNGETDSSCDGVDNNCNGQKDEGFVGVQTRCGVGACAATGTSTCANGVEDRAVGTCVAGNATAEVCDGVDNDCDQKTDQLDDSLEVAPNCANQAGECLGAKRTRCQGAAGWAACTDADYVAKSPFYSSVELCDSKDNNCGGGTDEGFGLGDSCSVGLGACTATGTRVCLANKSGGCSVQPGAPANETCNAVDDNCDGMTDNVVDGEGSVCPDLDTAITGNPDPRTASDVAQFDYVDTVTASNTHFQCQLDGGAWTTCDGGSTTYEELSNGSHTFLVRAVGVLGNVDETPAYYAWIVDTTVPETTVLSGPQNPSQSHTGEFVFGSNVAEPSAWWCAIDPVGDTPSEEEWFLCDATYTWSELAEGPHTIWVFVVNEIGVADETPAMYQWVIDSTAPGTDVTVQPSAVTCDTTVTFAFRSPDDETVTNFRCRLDDWDWTDCDGSEATYEGLEDGPHVFSVASLDNNGNLDPTPASVRFVVDTAAPETTIEIGPQDPAQSNVAVFSFGSNEEGVTFYCRLDGGIEGEFSACASPMAFKGLREGPHHFEVYAADMGCLSDETPASWDWLIDTRLPETAFLATPPVLNGKDDKNVFVYEDPTDPQLTTFECMLDGGKWVACDGGRNDLGLLAVGTHTLTVRACDHVTETFVQCDPTPVVYTWQVTESPCPLDAQPPMLSCAADFTVECKKEHGEVDLAAIAATASDECAPVASGTNAGTSYPVGTSPIVFQATDGNGNRSSCITLVTVVDRVAPTITCPAAVVLEAPVDSCGLAHDLGKAVVADGCYGASVVSFSNAPQVFGVGETVVTFTALDLGGNAATCTTKVTVEDKTPVVLTCEDAVDREAPADACSWTGTLQATAVDNCSVDAMVLERTNRYKIGTQDVEFSASDESGNATTCVTLLTVKDVTAPVIDCGEPTGPVPATVTAVAADACTALAEIVDFTCTKVAADGTRTAIDDVTCGVSFEGDTLTVAERLEDGTLEISYSVIADDPSDNRGTKDCTVSFGADRDGDGIVDTADNCIDVANTDQVNSDTDNLGDACDVCAKNADPDQTDTDADGVGDACDNCQAFGNVGQEDGDADGVGDACDVCPEVADAGQADIDSDGMGDLCQDTDKDEVLDVNDNCPLDANEDQSDFDEDGVGNPCDPTDAGIVAKGGVDGCAGGAGETGVALALAALGLVLARRRKV